MKHIYLFCMQSSGVVYGIGTYIQQLTEALKQEKDVSLNIVIYNSEESEFTIKKNEGVSTFYFPRINNQFNYPHSQFESAYCRNICFLLNRHIRLEPSDQLIFHLNYYEENICIPYFKKEFPDCKVIFTVHYQRWCFLLNGNTTCFKKLIHQKQDILSYNEKLILASYQSEKNALYAVDKIICLAEFTKNILIEDYQVVPEKVEVIYNGLKDEGKILSQKEKGELRKKMSFSKEELLILFVGRLDQTKGLHILIQAFKIILNTYTQARLIIVGDGNYNLFLKECKDYWKKITFTGRLDRQAVYEFYQIADTAVIPSFNEQCSYVAIEMMMFGIPLVISTSTGLSEMIDDKFNPVKVNVLENETSGTILPDELATKIIAALRDKKQQNNMRRNYLKKFLPSEMGKRYINLLNQ